MIVESWAVGAASSVHLPMTTGDISGHLLADWIPSFPMALSSSFIGWPSFLIETVSVQKHDFLTLAPATGTSERQWKGVLSWMLGVAGARHMLAAEGYRWIAPLSAFYEDNNHQVALQPNFPYPRSSIKASRDPKNASHLRPDYLAIRPTPSTNPLTGYEWVLAEAKGTASSLKNKTKAPQQWSEQVRNAVIKWNGATLTVPRHLVICTRVNPNAVHAKTRRLQLRSWNRKNLEAGSLPSHAAVQVATVHLFGLFKGLHLPNYAVALAMSAQVRAKERNSEPNLRERIQARLFLEYAQDEIVRRTEAPPDDAGIVDETWTTLTTPTGRINIGLAAPLLQFAKELGGAMTDVEAADALQRADKSLDTWEMNRRINSSPSRLALLSTGIAVSLARQ